MYCSSHSLIPWAIAYMLYIYIYMLVCNTLHRAIFCNITVVIINLFLSKRTYVENVCTLSEYIIYSFELEV